MDAVQFPSGFFATYKDDLVVVAWGLAIIGWLITAKLNSKLELRKEIRLEIDRIGQKAEIIINLAKNYYCSPVTKKDVSKSSKIAFEVTRLVSRVERLNKRIKTCDGKPFNSAEKCCGDVFESITGEDFKSSSRTQVAIDSLLILEIEQSIHELLNSLEDGFCEAFD